jgi:hypothetical protein
MILKLKEVALLSFLRLCMIWVILALSFQVFMLGASVIRPSLTSRISNELTWRLDGRFSNDSTNIWYKK